MHIGGRKPEFLTRQEYELQMQRSLKMRRGEMGDMLGEAGIFAAGSLATMGVGALFGGPAGLIAGTLVEGALTATVGYGIKENQAAREAALFAVSTRANLGVGQRSMKWDDAEELRRMFHREDRSRWSYLPFIGDRFRNDTELYDVWKGDYAGGMLKNTNLQDVDAVRQFTREAKGLMEEIAGLANTTKDSIRETRAGLAQFNITHTRDVSKILHDITTYQLAGGLTHEQAAKEYMGFLNAGLSQGVDATSAAQSSMNQANYFRLLQEQGKISPWADPAGLAMNQQQMAGHWQRNTGVGMAASASGGSLNTWALWEWAKFVGGGDPILGYMELKAGTRSFLGAPQEMQLAFLRNQLKELGPREAFALLTGLTHGDVALTRSLRSQLFDGVDVGRIGLVGAVGEIQRRGGQGDHWAHLSGDTLKKNYNLSRVAIEDPEEYNRLKKITAAEHLIKQSELSLKDLREEFEYMGYSKDQLDSIIGGVSGDMLFMTLGRQGVDVEERIRQFTWSKETQTDLFNAIRTYVRDPKEAEKRIGQMTGAILREADKQNQKVGRFSLQLARSFNVHESIAPQMLLAYGAEYKEKFEKSNIAKRGGHEAALRMAEHFQSGTMNREDIMRLAEAAFEANTINRTVRDQLNEIALHMQPGVTMSVKDLQGILALQMPEISDFFDIGDIHAPKRLFDWKGYFSITPQSFGVVGLSNSYHYVKDTISNGNNIADLQQNFGKVVSSYLAASGPSRKTKEQAEAKKKVDDFISRMAKERGLDEKELRKAFLAHGSALSHIEKTMDRLNEAKRIDNLEKKREAIMDITEHLDSKERAGIEYLIKNDLLPIDKSFLGNHSWAGEAIGELYNTLNAGAADWDKMWEAAQKGQFDEGKGTINDLALSIYTLSDSIAKKDPTKPNSSTYEYRQKIEANQRKEREKSNKNNGEKTTTRTNWEN